MCLQDQGWKEPTAGPGGASPAPEPQGGQRLGGSTERLGEGDLGQAQGEGMSWEGERPRGHPPCRGRMGSARLVGVEVGKPYDSVS